MNESNNWKDFRISELFTVENSSPYHKRDLDFTKKYIPYVTRTSLNNGVENIVGYDEKFKINKKNSISLGAENADFFYQKYDYITGNKMYRISCDRMNEPIGLFLVEIFKNSIKNTGYGFGIGLTGTRFKKRIIKLPIDLNGNPNWDYMESVGKRIIASKENNLIQYVNKKISSLNKTITKETITLDNKQWGVYEIQDLFETRRVTGKTIKTYEKGIFPYVSTSATKNGIIGFVDAKENETSKSNTITVNPISNAVFYQTYTYVGRGNAGSSINELHSSYLNKHIGLFIVRMISHSTSSKTSYAIQLNGDRLKKAKFKLPIDNQGNPDWKFMEQYMQQLELKKLIQLRDYYINKI